MFLKHSTFKANILQMTADFTNPLRRHYRSILTGVGPKQETKHKVPSLASKKPVSVEAIRRSVRDSLKEILTQRSVFHE